jgi:hypothetical protein
MGKKMYRIGHWKRTRKEADNEAHRLKSKRGVRNVRVLPTVGLKSKARNKMKSKYGQGYYVMYSSHKRLGVWE